MCDFLPYLAIDRDPSGDRLLHGLRLRERLHLEAPLVRECDDVLQFKPLFDLCVRLALERWIYYWLLATLLEPDDD